MSGEEIKVDVQKKTGEEEKPTEKKKMTKGGRNLSLLGLAAVLIALGTTGVSLLIYHNTGDIYLDRSRPGYLPDEEEVEKDEEKQKAEGDYEFDKSGKLTAEILTEYLEKLDIEVKAIDSYDNAFSGDALSDEKLGIQKTETTDVSY